MRYTQLYVVLHNSRRSAQRSSKQTNKQRHCLQVAAAASTAAAPPIGRRTLKTFKGNMALNQTHQEHHDYALPTTATTAASAAVVQPNAATTHPKPPLRRISTKTAAGEPVLCFLQGLEPRASAFLGSHTSPLLHNNLHAQGARQH